MFAEARSVADEPDFDFALDFTPFRSSALNKLMVKEAPSGKY